MVIGEIPVYLPALGLGHSQLFKAAYIPSHVVPPSLNQEWYSESFSWVKYLSYLLPSAGESSRMISRYNWIISLLKLTVPYNITTEVKSQSHRTWRSEQVIFAGHISSVVYNMCHSPNSNFFATHKISHFNWQKIFHILLVKSSNHSPVDGNFSFSFWIITQRWHSYWKHRLWYCTLKVYQNICSVEDTLRRLSYYHRLSK